MTSGQLHQPAVPDLPAQKDDFNDLSRKDLESAVARVCGAYGTVLKVVAHLSQGHVNVRAFALVDMSEPEEAERLAIAFSRPRVGSAVVLLLPPRSGS